MNMGRSENDINIDLQSSSQLYVTKVAHLEIVISTIQKLSLEFDQRECQRNMDIFYSPAL